MKARKIQQRSSASTKLHTLVLIVASMGLIACGTIKPYYDKAYEDWESTKLPDTSELKYSVYLIGDAGENKGKRMVPTLKLLRNMIYTKIDTLLENSRIDPATQQVCYDTSFKCHSEVNRNTVVFLGDNIYHYGLPPEDAKNRKDKERIIDQQLEVVRYFKGNVFFVPGNHDWNQSRKGGLAAINRQEDYIEKSLNNPNAFLPSNGCPGPVERHITNDLTMIFVDSEWWLYPHEDEKPIGIDNGCNINDKFDFTVQLADAIKRNKNKNIIIVQHHPLFTNGNHGGHYSLKDYFFPLTLIRPNLYIPLPVLGSIYPLMRKYGVSQEDLSHPAYQQLKDAMLTVMENQKNLVFAAGHEHNLQYRKVDDIHHVVSGSGCKDKYAVKGLGAGFVHDHTGFARINYYENNQAWIEFFEPVGDGTTGEVVFRAPLYALTPELADLPKDFDCSDSVITVAASKEYKAGPVKKAFFGEHYREEWRTPVKAHLLDLKCEKGGLLPTAKGGGKQTVSIRLISQDSVEYTLRTISKDPSSLIPLGLRKTFANDILQDQMSSAHPYGALVIPPMANAAGVFHANPELFYVPHSPELGQYLDDVGGKLAILEERADGDLSKLRSFGYSKNIVSVKSMYKNIMKDNHNKIDQKFYLKARIFDMFIGDWDRHDDNWRWGEFKKGSNTIYKAIPRDRDQVFVKFDGIVPYIFRTFAVRNFNHFTGELKNMKGLNKSASLLDKTLITEPTLEEWLAIADTIKLSMTDSVIENAIKKFPPEIYALSGKEITDKLKLRREQLHKAALDYYMILSQTVEVIGSNAPEKFLVNRKNDNETEVTILGESDTNKGVYDRQVYHRVFKSGETKKVILYGLEGDDIFVLRGEGRKGPVMKIIGGKGKDTYQDSTNLKGIKKTTKVLDYKGEENVIAGNVNARLSSNKKVIEYESYKQLEYKSSSLKPKLFAEYNTDYGFYTGAGLLMTNYNFGKPPANSEHHLNFHYATNTNSRIYSYKGYFHSFLAKNYDLQIYLRQSGPDNQINYFGLGNETKWNKDLDIDNYRLNIGQQYAYVGVAQKTSLHTMVSAGPQYQRTILTQESNVVVNGPEKFVQSVLGPQNIYGFRVNGVLNVLDNDDDPTRGIKLTLKSAINVVDRSDEVYTPFSGDLSFYLTPRAGTFPMTMAFRFGGATIIGEHPFYESNFIGGTTNLRGFRWNRFAGHSMAYQNVDLRFRLFEFRNYVFTGKWGFLGFVDNARVWTDSERSTKWHTGYGPGAWVNLYSLFILSGSLGFSDEGKFVTVTGGFFF